MYAKRIRFLLFQCYENLQLNHKNLINGEREGCARANESLDVHCDSTTTHTNETGKERTNFASITFFWSLFDTALEWRCVRLIAAQFK